MVYGDEEYTAKMLQFISEAGPNPGGNFTRKWGWHEDKKEEFGELMRAEGVEGFPAPYVPTKEEVAFDLWFSTLKG